MLPKGHLSYSQLSMFADCPACWKAVHVDGMEQPSTVAMRLGGAVHDLIARHLSGVVGDEEQVLAAHDLDPAKATEGLEMFTDWLGRWADTADGCAPSQIEDTIEWEVATEPPVQFVARLDFWREDDDELVIYDWKTSARLPADGEVAGDTGDLWAQLLTYALGFRKARQERDRFLLRQVYVRYNVTHERAATEDMLATHDRALVASCQAVLLAVQAGKFPRRPGRACGTCPLRKECDLSLPLGDGHSAADVARAWLWHREREKETKEALLAFLEDGEVAVQLGDLPEAVGVQVGYLAKARNQTVTRTVNKQKQVLGVTEEGEEVWVYPRTEEKMATRLDVVELKQAAVAAEEA